MNIEYKDIKDIKQEDLQELFLSVEWSSGHYPEKLAIAISNSDTVITAWDGDKLIGLVNALDDTIMTAYFHYFLVNPTYQDMGIGKELSKRIIEVYKDYMRIVLVAYDKEIGFYKNCGFEVGKDVSPMFVTSLWT